MKRLLATIAGLGLAVAGRAETPLWVTPDVRTLESGGTELLPWQIFRYDAAGPTYTLELTVPGQPRIDAIHKLDKPGWWLLSVGAPSDLGGSLAQPAEPRDVIQFDADTDSYALFFCGAAAGIPPGANIDALYLAGGDGGDLIVSFEVPVELPAGSGAFFEPSDLVAFERQTDGCADWSLSADNPSFDASAAGSGVPAGANLTATAALSGVDGLLLSLNVPSELAPSAGPSTFVRGQIASWDGATFDLFEALSDWPAGSIVNALSCQANPGRVQPTSGPLLIGKTLGNRIILSWSPSCASGAEDYGIYEGTIAAVSAGIYDHVQIDCNDAAPLLLTETILPGPGSRYYLVVPHNLKDEGSYGISSDGTERPQAAAEDERCIAVQNLTPCP